MTDSSRPLNANAARLRRLFAAPAPIVIAGAHNGLSARIVEQAGFDGVWASGFEISASYGVPDASILTMTEMLDVTRAITDAVSIPVIADCDTGYGELAAVRRTVREMEAAGAAAIRRLRTIDALRRSRNTAADHPLLR